MLIDCPECSRQISDDAITCPHCGYPVRRKKIAGKSRQVAAHVANVDYKRAGKVLKIIFKTAMFIAMSFFCCLAFFALTRIAMYPTGSAGSLFAGICTAFPLMLWVFIARKMFGITTGRILYIICAVVYVLGIFSMCTVGIDTGDWSPLVGWAVGALIMLTTQHKPSSVENNHSPPPQPSPKPPAKSIGPMPNPNHITGSTIAGKPSTSSIPATIFLILCLFAAFALLHFLSIKESQKPEYPPPSRPTATHAAAKTTPPAATISNRVSIINPPKTRPQEKTPFADINHTEEAVLSISVAFMHCFSQLYALGKIIIDYPSLHDDADHVVQAIQRQHTSAIDKIRAYLDGGESDEPLLEMLEKTIMANIDNEHKIKISSQQNAMAFIRGVLKDNTSHTNAPLSNAKKMLLAFEYFDSPEKELANGISDTIKGTFPRNNWQLTVPKSWKVTTDSTSYDHNVTSHNGFGLQSFSISARPYFATIKNEDFISEKNMREGLKMTNQTAEFIRYERTTINGQEIGILEHYAHNRYASDIRSRTVTYGFAKNNRIYMMAGSVASFENVDLEPRMAKYRPLFDLIAQSLVVNEH